MTLPCIPFDESLTSSSAFRGLGQHTKCLETLSRSELPEPRTVFFGELF